MYDNSLRQPNLKSFLADSKIPWKLEGASHSLTQATNSEKKFVPVELHMTTQIEPINDIGTRKPTRPALKAFGHQRSSNLPVMPWPPGTIQLIRRWHLQRKEIGGAVGQNAPIVGIPQLTEQWAICKIPWLPLTTTPQSFRDVQHSPTSYWVRLSFCGNFVSELSMIRKYSTGLVSQRSLVWTLLVQLIFFVFWIAKKFDLEGETPCGHVDQIQKNKLITSRGQISGKWRKNLWLCLISFHFMCSILICPSASTFYTLTKGVHPFHFVTFALGWH